MSVMDSQPRPPHHRNRSSFSFRSNKSDKSNKVKMDLRETPRDKARTHLTETTKANPNAAMNEAQPNSAALEQSTLASLRSIQHKDEQGNVIAEPDLSNPTRSRWERPLDTIRSFEASIDEAHRRRSIMRADTATEVGGSNSNQRLTYYSNHESGQNTNRFSQVSGYYVNRAPPARDQVDNGYGYPSTPNLVGKRPNPRMHSDPMMHRPGYPHGPGHGSGSSNVGGNGRSIYPSPGYHRSRDTVDSNGSPSEPWVNSTEPSSENSSIDRVKPDGSEQYGFAGYGGAPNLHKPIPEERTFGGAGPYPQHSEQRAGGSYFPSTVIANPAKQPTYPQQANYSVTAGGPSPSASDTATKVPTITPATRPVVDQKRKSWFKRRFSKDS